MKTVIKNILEALSKKGYSVTVKPEESSSICLNNKNVKYTYKDEVITDEFDAFHIAYTDLVMDPGFKKPLADIIWDKAPRSKRTKPKIVWLEGQLIYDNKQQIIDDINMLFNLSVANGDIEEWLSHFYKANIIPLLNKNAKNK